MPSIKMMNKNPQIWRRSLRRFGGRLHMYAHRCNFTPNHILNVTTDMSTWRKEASKHLPELQRIISARTVDNPMMLWLELQFEFAKLCKHEPPPLDLLRRFWNYAKWCMESGDEDVATAAALGFCEHFLDSEASTLLLPQIMSRQDYESLRSLLLYHNSPEQYEMGLKHFDFPEAR